MSDLENLETMDIDALRALAAKMKLTTGGNRAQLISRIEKTRKEASSENDGGQGGNTSNTGDQGAADANLPTAGSGDGAAATVPTTLVVPATDAPAVQYVYTPKSGETLSLAGLIVPAKGARFDAPSSAHEAFVPYYLERTTVAAE